MNHLGPTIQWSTGCNWPFLGFILWTKSFVIIMTKVSKKICESPLCFVMHCDCTASLRHTAVHSSRQKWTEKGRCPCVANKWQFAFRAAIFTAHTFYTGPLFARLPASNIPYKCICWIFQSNYSELRQNLWRWALGWGEESLLGILADESYILINLPPSTYASQSSSPLSWASGSKQEVTLGLLLPSPPPCFPAGTHKTIWRQNSAIRFKPLREMRCNW